MIVLGVDPGLAHTGWGVVEAQHGRLKALAYGVITTPATETLTVRLESINREIDAVIERYRPVVCALEGIFFGINAKSALSLGEARAAAILAAAHRGLPAHEYSPTQVKQTLVGTGRADKKQVAYMVKALLKLDHEPHPDHCSDALAIAITHATLAGL